MTSWRQAIGYGFLVWLIPFLVAFASLPIKQSWRSLFESIMAATLSIVVVACAVFYVRRVPRVSIRDGVCLGMLWLAMSVLIGGHVKAEIRRQVRSVAGVMVHLEPFEEASPG